MRSAPVPMLPWFTFPLRVIGSATSSLSELALIYTGLTGDAFFPSARRARALTTVTNSSGGVPRYRRSGSDSMHFLQCLVGEMELIFVCCCSDFGDSYIHTANFNTPVCVNNVSIRRARVRCTRICTFGCFVGRRCDRACRTILCRTCHRHVRLCLTYHLLYCC